jgi:hypothetical protein
MKRYLFLLFFVLQTASGQTGKPEQIFYMTCHKDNGGGGISLTMNCSAPMNRFYLYRWGFNAEFIDSIILAEPAVEVTFNNCLYAGSYGVQCVLYEGDAWTRASMFQVCWTFSGKIIVQQPELFWLAGREYGRGCVPNEGGIGIDLHHVSGNTSVILKNENGETVGEKTVSVDRDDYLVTFRNLTNGRYYMEAVDQAGCYNSRSGSSQYVDVENAGTYAVAVDIIDRLGTCAASDGYIISKGRYIGAEESYPIMYELYSNNVRVKYNTTGIFEQLPEGIYTVKVFDQIEHCTNTSEPVTLAAEGSMNIIINTEIP